jgi:RecA-family ATPase
MSSSDELDYSGWGAEELPTSNSEITLVSAADFVFEEPPEQEWLIKDQIPLGKVAMLSGPGGLGKSMLTLQYAVAVATGNSVCWGMSEVCYPGSVAICNFEDDKNELHRRLHRIVMKYSEDAKSNPKLPNTSADKRIQKHIHRLHVVQLPVASIRFMDEIGQPTDDLYYFIEQLKLLEDLHLVVLDPLRRLMNGSEDSSEVAANTIALAERIARETGATVMLVHHTSKQAAKSRSADQFSVRGSSALSDLVRLQIVMNRVPNPAEEGLNPDGEYIKCVVAKNNYGPSNKDDAFFRREEGGVLSHVHTSGSFSQEQYDSQMVVNLIREKYHSGFAYCRKDLLTQKLELGLKMSDQRITRALELAVDEQILEKIKRPNYKSGGKCPRDFLPVGAAHPGCEND